MSAESKINSNTECISDKFFDLVASGANVSKESIEIILEQTVQHGYNLLFLSSVEFLFIAVTGYFALKYLFNCIEMDKEKNGKDPVIQLKIGILLFLFFIYTLFFLSIVINFYNGIIASQTPIIYLINLI